MFLQAYIFRDYWEDIGTIKSFYDANLALTDEVELFAFASCNVISISHLFYMSFLDNNKLNWFSCLQFPKFEFYDPKTPFYTSPRFLPPTKIDNCKVTRMVS